MSPRTSDAKKGKKMARMSCKELSQAIREEAKADPWNLLVSAIIYPLVLPLVLPIAIFGALFGEKIWDDISNHY
jgi:hypothetical protein